jgi:hypothetical protein
MSCLKFVRKVSRRIAGDEAAWSAVSIVPPRLGFAVAGLHQFDPKQLKDQVHKQIQRSELSCAPVVGGIGFAIQAIKGRAFWRPQISLVVRDSEKGPVRTVFADHYQPSQATPRPVYVRTLDKATLLINALDNNGTANGDLRADQWREIAPLLHEWGYTSQLI